LKGGLNGKLPENKRSKRTPKNRAYQPSAWGQQIRAVQKRRYLQQLVRWTQEALKGAEEGLKSQPRGNKKHDLEKGYLKQEIEHL
jgi:hypothetical protein